MTAPKKRAVRSTSLAARIAKFADDNPDDALTMRDVMLKFGSLYPVTSMALKGLVERGVLIETGRMFMSARFDSRKEPLAVVTLERLGYAYDGKSWSKAP